MTASQGLVAFLQTIPQNLQAPHFPQLLAAAGNLSEAQDAAVIFTLLGPAGALGSDVPQGPLTFPADHQMHLDMGTEWYWLSVNLTVDDTFGLDRLGACVVIKRTRSVSNDVQQAAGWTDIEAQVVQTAATVTIATREKYEIVRRRQNVQWPALGGSVAFGNPSDPFLYVNGPDSLSGSVDVLPLVVHIDDGPNMTLDLTMGSLLPDSSAFFLQGVNGMTTGAKPGFYYSWPQLLVSGSVTAGGTTYNVHGTGWIDHQLMMDDPTPAAPPVPPPPPPEYVPTGPVKGWSWCQFNLVNGDAFTVLTVQAGTLRDILSVPYGWYLRSDGVRWSQTYLTGTLQLDRFVPGLEGVLIPSAWKYTVTDLSGGSGVDITLLAVPWYPDGSFMTSDLAIPGETPVDVALVDYALINTQSGSGAVRTGSGYCESVGYEPLQRYVQRGLAYLKRTT